MPVDAGMVLRHATRRDLDLTESIENEADALLVALLRPEHWTPAPTGRERGSLPGFTLMAVERGTERAVGFVHVLEVDGFAHLEQVSVLPDATRRGFGRRLVEAAVDEAAARGYDRITLRTFADVPWNAPFYATCGFVETEPASEFHRGLVAVEERLGLPALGRRIQMTRRLDAVPTQDPPAAPA
ncbi:GNAT family N-acetyltransferase [Agromyces sp. Marseille-Q5079]|uniref:GNAT family N-acetyltransferase n=1 Tax=Agromyces sp. Marseille-Q5079 TaxID=3439059 RepID=UPI003D9C8C36